MDRKYIFRKDSVDIYFNFFYKTYAIWSVSLETVGSLKKINVNFQYWLSWFALIDINILALLWVHL